VTASGVSGTAGEAETRSSVGNLLASFAREEWQKHCAAGTTAALQIT
jgi:hypothetical protein